MSARVIVAAGTLDRAKQFRDDLDLPADTRLTSLYHHSPARGIMADVVVIESSVANDSDIGTLVASVAASPIGRAYFVEQIR